MAAPHRQSERDFVRAFAAEAGLTTQVAVEVWEGQADLQALVGSNRHIATWGTRSSRASVEEVRGLLPSNAKLLDLQLQPPFTHGSLALAPLANHAGDTILLAHGAAFVSVHVEAVRRFVGNSVEVLPIDRDDALGFACHALCVNGTLILPSGVSAGLRGQLVRRGFILEELDLPELCGKGGGGPRALVNELRGLVLGDGAPDYASRREELVARLDEYPETVTKGAT
jgi:N-dimethylarginine dimethylaminohydrolase